MISGYDIHGHHDKLVSLLRHLGYHEHNGAWRHPGRQALFVGDLIDRGPAQVATVMTVRRMVDAGSARCIMGNHEFNAVAWATPDPQNPGEYLRLHGKPGNRQQHAGFLSEVEGRPLHAELIDWFRTLPPALFETGSRRGHYWFTGEPRVLRENAACLDYSAARDGPLVAYRWDGESRLSSDRMRSSGA